MKTIDQPSLWLHPLQLKVYELLKPLLVETINLKSSVRLRKLEGKLNVEEEYHYNVFWYLANMTQASMILRQSLIYIIDFPKPKSYFKKGITQYAWVQYHYHLYLVALVGVYDIALKLTNAIFRLGIEEKSVNKSTVEDNFWVKSTQLSKELHTLSMSKKELRLPRNLFIHGGDLVQLKGLDELNLFCTANKLASQLSATWSPDIKLPNVNEIKEEFEYKIKDFSKEMETEVNTLENNVISLFDKLLPIYDHWTLELRKGSYTAPH